jgi:hypothetical protein
LVLERRIALSGAVYGDVNLKERAVSQGVSYATARSWYRAGLMPVPTRKVGGLVLVTADTDVPTSGLILSAEQALLRKGLKIRVIPNGPG